MLFACLHAPGCRDTAQLLACAGSFSPAVEETVEGTVVLDIEGLERLYGAADAIARALAAEAARIGIEARVAVAANPDAALHAARGLAGIHVIPGGEELRFLGRLPLDLLVPSLAGIEPERAREIVETLALWGIRTFQQLAALPPAGLAERLGPEGVRLQKLAAGRTRRLLVPARPPPSYARSLELEHPISDTEPLLFVLGSLANQLCDALRSRSLAARELRLRMHIERGAPTSPSSPSREDERVVRLALPMRDPKLFMKLLELEIAERPPAGPLVGLELAAEPARPRVVQKGLFAPATPEPEKLELVVARIARLIGAARIGSAELQDSHRPDAFVMTRFTPWTSKAAVAAPPRRVVALRRLRPPVAVAVRTDGGRPAHVAPARRGDARAVSGKVVGCAGPWRSSGDWWGDGFWSRDEWDVEISEGGLCRIYRDPQRDAWFLDGIYD